MTRNRLMIAAVVLAIAVAALTFPLWRPIFVDDVVDEPFPELSEIQQTSFAAMPEDEQTFLTEMREENEEMAVEMTDARTRADIVMTEDMMPEESAPAALFTGSFRDVSTFYQGSGSATIYQLEDGARVLRFEDFRVTNGPDLHVLLSTSADPANRAEFDAGEYIDLGVLKGNVGNQNYDIPADVDLSQYNSIVIYCLPFHVLFSVAPIAAS